MLGEVEETVYVVEDEDDEREAVKVLLCSCVIGYQPGLTNGIDGQEAVRDAFRSRFVMKSGYTVNVHLCVLTRYLLRGQRCTDLASNIYLKSAK